MIRCLVLAPFMVGQARGLRETGGHVHDQVLHQSQAPGVVIIVIEG